MSYKVLSTIFLFLTANIMFSQSLKVKLLEDLAEISFVSIDEYMENANAFLKVDIDKNESQKYFDGDGGQVRIYLKMLNDDIDNTIYITVLSHIKAPRNTVDIIIGKNISIHKLKENLIENNYEYEGKNVIGALIYKKDKYAVVIREKINDSGATQINFVYQN